MAPSAPSVDLVRSLYAVFEAYEADEECAARIDPPDWLDMLADLLRDRGLHAKVWCRPVIGIDHPPVQHALEVHDTQGALVRIDEQGLDADRPTDRFIEPGEWEVETIYSGDRLRWSEYGDLLRRVELGLAEWEAQRLEASLPQSHPHALPRPRM